jgi:hypothetical protein
VLVENFRLETALSNFVASNYSLVVGAITTGIQSVAIGMETRALPAQLFCRARIIRLAALKAPRTFSGIGKMR